MATRLDGAVTHFRGRFPGQVLLAEDAGYDKAREVWNAEIDRRPAVIARCATPAEVVAALAFGRGQGLEISVRGGGHNFSGVAVAEAGLMMCGWRLPARTSSMHSPEPIGIARTKIRLPPGAR